MSRLPTFSKRVPLYIFLPVVVACGAAGYIANTIGPLSTIFGQAQFHRQVEPEPSHAAVVTSPISSDQKEYLGSTAPPRDASVTPTPAPKVIDRDERLPANLIKPAAPPNPVTKAMPETPRATRVLQSKPHRPQRAARQPTKTPATASTGLKSIPLIGPVFSLLQ